MKRLVLFICLMLFLCIFANAQTVSERLDDATEDYLFGTGAYTVDVQETKKDFAKVVAKDDLGFSKEIAKNEILDFKQIINGEFDITVYDAQGTKFKSQELNSIVATTIKGNIRVDVQIEDEIIIARVSGAGKAKVTVKKDGYNDFVFYVEFNHIFVEKIFLNIPRKYMNVGETYKLKATVLPDNATNKKVVWETWCSDSIVKVDQNGNVTALGEGKGVIFAIADDNFRLRARCDIYVDPPIKVNKIVLSKTSGTLKEGQTGQLKATVLPENATNKKIIWKSKNKSIATVDQNGLVTGVARGTTYIRAFSAENEKIYATCEVTVKKAYVKVTGLMLIPDYWTIKPNETYQLSATVIPGDATDKTIMFVSQNPSIATVDNNGLIKALKPGKVKIKAVTRDGGFTKCCNLTVAVPVTGVELNKHALTLVSDETFQLRATVKPGNATDKSVKFFSQDPSIAKVGRRTGLITARLPGTVKIRAVTRDGRFTDYCTVIVKIPVIGVELKPKTLTLKQNETYKLKATIIPYEATYKTVKFESQDPSIATVDNNGLVKALNSGKVKIKVVTEDGGFTDYCKLTVVIPATGVKLNTNTLTLRPNDTYQLRARVLPANATDKTVKFESQDPSIATVDNNGLVKALKPGNIKIKAVTNDGGFADYCKLTVVTPVTGVKLNTNTLALKPNETYQLRATVLPANATDKTVKFESQDPSIATVDKTTGLVKALKLGNVKIKVVTKDGGFADYCKLSVKKEIPVTGVVLNEHNVHLNVHCSYQLRATVLPENAKDKTVKFESNNPSVATVNQNGLVEARKTGKAIIKVVTNDGHYSDTCFFACDTIITLKTEN